jgi:deazaflavin-dependent oxidoreductase (nitroreductase family)
MPDDETSSTYKPPVLDLFGEEHVRQYRATEGEVGYEWNGATCLLLTTTGRKSGEPRTQPLIFSNYEDSYVVVASQGGAPTHPSWYYNFRAHPEVTLQDGSQKWRMVAREVDGPERDEWWERAVAAFPPYAEYQRKTERRIPVFVLEPADES